MQVTVLGSGSPIPDPERNGTGIALRIGTDTVLIDCGPGIVDQMVRSEIHPATVEDLFFTHQHMDHNASFFEFVIASWRLGRKSLTVYGPDGTKPLLDSIEEIYKKDIEYRQHLGASLEGIKEIAYQQVDDQFQYETDEWSVKAMPVEHSIETFAYRFEEKSTGASVVFSGDTKKVPALSEFSDGADILIHDAPFGPNGDVPSDQLVWNKVVGKTEEYDSKLKDVHATPTEAGQIAADAGVNTLVLTHISPYRDTSAMCAEAKSAFDGTVLTAEDGLTITAPF